MAKKTKSSKNDDQEDIKKSPRTMNASTSGKNRSASTKKKTPAKSKKGSQSLKKSWPSPQKTEIYSIEGTPTLLDNLEIDFTNPNNLLNEINNLAVKLNSAINIKEALNDILSEFSRMFDLTNSEVWLLDTEVG